MYSNSHTSVRPGEPCPDPSIHSALAKDKSLQNAASKSALYGDYSSTNSRQDIFGPDGKLTGASAAASLRYAKPHELPSHPIVGIDTSSSANQAANLASNVNKRDWWQPQSSENGYSAARLAYSKGNSPAKMGYSLPEGERQGALLAATNLAKPGSDRIGTPAMEASRVKNINMSREMFTEHPPLKVEIEEQRRQDALKASKAVLAKQFQALEQNKNAPPKAGKPTYPGLKEHAQQLAADRLAKLDPDGIMAYREHYGYGVSPGRSSLSARGKSSGPEADDEAQARKIRGQMGKINNQLADIDEQKRQKDRATLMAAAEKRVQARMSAMDEKVFMETGKMTPAISADWEAQAKAKAEANSEGRMLTHGKVHIGGGKFMDMSEIEAIAAARMQPTLDEITETAAAQRQRDEEIRIATEERKKQEMEEKAIAQHKKDEERMKAYQERNELKEKKAIEKAERDRVKEEERYRLSQLRVEQKHKEAEEKAERDRVKAEEKAESDRIKAEEKIEKDRIKAEEKEEQAARDAAQKEKDLKFKQEQEAVKLAGKTTSEDDVAVVETTETRSVAETTIKAGKLTEEETVALAEEAAALGPTTTTFDVEETDEIRAGNTLLKNETAEGIANRVLGSPIKEEVEGETTVVKKTETMEEALAEAEELGGIRTIPTSLTASSKVKGSRRASFFNRFKRLSRSQSSKDKIPTTTTTTADVLPGPSEYGTKVEDTTPVAHATAVDTTDGAVDKADTTSEGGLYSEPSEDPTERPNGDHVENEEATSAYGTDYGSRPRRSEETGDETGDERFVEARDHMESGLTTPAEVHRTLDDGAPSKFQESI